MENVSTLQKGSKRGAYLCLVKAFFNSSMYLRGVIDRGLHPALRDAFPLVSEVLKEVSAPLLRQDQGYN